MSERTPAGDETRACLEVVGPRPCGLLPLDRAGRLAEVTCLEQVVRQAGTSRPASGLARTASSWVPPTLTCSRAMGIRGRVGLLVLTGALVAPGARVRAARGQSLADAHSAQHRPSGRRDRGAERHAVRLQDREAQGRRHDRDGRPPDGGRPGRGPARRDRGPHHERHRVGGADDAGGDQAARRGVLVHRGRGHGARREPSRGGLHVARRGDRRQAAAEGASPRTTSRSRRSTSCWRPSPPPCSTSS